MKLSIITVNLNNAEGLQKTIESVISQTFTDFEYIIIDGGSTDCSVTVIQEYADKVSYWVSEPDKGIYNAMNKGIRKATGEYCLFLNSGDHFFENRSLEKFHIYENDKFDIVYGDILVQKQNQESIKTYPDTLLFSYFLQDTLPHPASLIRKKILSTRLYNENLKICSDWEFFIVSICKHNCSYKHIKEIISVFLLDGLSSNIENNELITQEKNSVLNRYFNSFIKDYVKLEKIIEFQNAFNRNKTIKIIQKLGLVKKLQYD